jgi:hypothetical protein
MVATMQEMPTEDERLQIDYESAMTTALARRERRRRFFARLRRLALLTLGLGCAAWMGLLLLPHGRWYVGRNPQWIIASDPAGLTLGPTDRAIVLLSIAQLVMIEVFLLGLIAWGGRWLFIGRIRGDVTRCNR